VREKGLQRGRGERERERKDNMRAKVGIKREEK